MNILLYIVHVLYNYCTDFVINLANVTGLSYYEVNFFIFIVIYPLLLVILPFVYLYQRSRLIKLKNKAFTESQNAQ